MKCSICGEEIKGKEFSSMPIKEGKCCEKCYKDEVQGASEYKSFKNIEER